MISGVRFFDPTLEDVTNFVTAVNEKVNELSEGQIENALNAEQLLLKNVLLYDAVILYVTAILTLNLADGSNVSCDQEDSWSYGSTIINYIRTVSIANKQTKQKTKIIESMI